MVFAFIQISSALLPSTNFTCTSRDGVRRLTEAMEVYQTLRDVESKVSVIAPADDQASGHETSHYRCAWVNSRVLDNCDEIPAPQSQNSLVMALDNAHHCSSLGGDYDLCSNA